jgi:MFS transporter, DHA3 family, macrolide efflux protein
MGVIFMESYEINRKTGIRHLLHYKNYVLLILANFISRFGDSLDSIAYGWMVYQLTGSKLLLGSLLAVNAMPNILLGPFCGVVADRFNKKSLVLAGFLGRGIMVSLTALLFMTGYLLPWHLFMFTIINSTLETMTSPAIASIVPLVISSDDYLSANSFSTSSYRFAELIGTGAAGAIIALTGISGAIFIDGATFFIAALIIFFISLEHDVIKNELYNLKGYLVDLKEGLHFVLNDKLIVLIMVLFAVTNFCLAPMNVLLPVFAKDVLKGGPELLSAAGVALSIGMILGGIIVAQIGSRFKISSFLILGLLFFGVSYASLFIPGNIIDTGLSSTLITAAAFFFIGFFVPVVTSPIVAYIMKVTDRGMMGRVSSFMAMISCSMIPLGASFTGFISEFFSTSVIFLSMGVIISLMAVAVTFNKKFRES